MSGRRKFMKSVGATTAGVIVGSEAKRIVENKISTQYAEFIPLLEWHDKHLRSEQIPSNLDVLVVEGSSIELFTRTGKEILFSANNYNERVWPDDAIIKFANGNTKVMYPDIVIKDEQLDLNIAEFARMFAGFVIDAGVTINFITNKINKKPLTSRRKWLYSAGLISGGVLSSSVIGSELMNLTRNITVLDRIFTRLNGIVTNGNPEDALDFFRNVVVANKMLIESESFSKEKNSPVKVAYNFGVGHQGISDFLIMGPDFCRFLISGYPQPILENIIKSNGGIEQFCSSRLIQVGKSNEGFTKFGTEHPNLNLYGYRDGITIDSKLQKILEEKLGTSLRSTKK